MTTATCSGSDDDVDAAIRRGLRAVLRPFRLQIAGAVVVMMLGVLLGALSPLFLEKVLNEALPRRDTRLLVELCLAIVVAVVISQALSVLQTSIVNRVGQQAVHRLRMGAYRGVRDRELTFFAADANADVQSRLVNDVTGINDFLTFTSQSALTSAISFVAAAVVMVVLDWRIGLVSVVLTVALTQLNARMARRRRLLAEQAQRVNADLLRHVSEDLSFLGIVLGRTSNRVDAQERRFDLSSSRLADLLYRQRLAGRSTAAMITVTLSCVPPIIFLLAGTVLHGISLGSAVVLATMQTRLAAPLQYILGAASGYQGVKAMLARLFEYVDGAANQPPVDDSIHDDDDILPTGDLVLDAVSYTYPGERGRTLCNVGLRLAPDSFTTLVGPSGSGKSTLALVISGLLEPDVGVIRVGDCGVSTEDLQRRVTYVPQDVLLLNGSLRENLLFVRPDATERELAEAITRADLDDVLAVLPRGLDTAVGEHGLQLSGGQRQRVALARAFLTDHVVLVVDEPASALDRASADRTVAGLMAWSSDHTVLLITHRPVALRPGDDRLTIGLGILSLPGAGQLF